MPNQNIQNNQQGNANLRVIPTEQLINALFKVFNEFCFGGELSMPNIICKPLQNSCGRFEFGHGAKSDAYGRVTIKETDTGNLYISTEPRHPLKIVETLLHEMVHDYVFYVLKRYNKKNSHDNLFQRKARTVEQYINNKLSILGIEPDAKKSGIRLNICSENSGNENEFDYLNNINAFDSIDIFKNIFSYDINRQQFSHDLTDVKKGILCLIHNTSPIAKQKEVEWFALKGPSNETELNEFNLGLEKIKSSLNGGKIDVSFHVCSSHGFVTASFEGRNLCGVGDNDMYKLATKLANYYKGTPREFLVNHMPAVKNIEEYITGKTAAKGSNTTNSANTVSTSNTSNTANISNITYNPYPTYHQQFFESKNMKQNIINEVAKKLLKEEEYTEVRVIGHFSSKEIAQKVAEQLKCQYDEHDVFIYNDNNRIIAYIERNAMDDNYTDEIVAKCKEKAKQIYHQISQSFAIRENKNKNAKKNKAIFTEGQIIRVVEESVKRILREASYK